MRAWATWFGKEQDEPKADAVLFKPKSTGEILDSGLIGQLYSHMYVALPPVVCPNGLVLQKLQVDEVSSGARTTRKRGIQWDVR